MHWLGLCSNSVGQKDKPLFCFDIAVMTTGIAGGLIKPHRGPKTAIEKQRPSRRRAPVIPAIK